MRIVFPILRILIGLIFVVSGFEKLSSPYQNFLYVIQGYELLPDGLALATAKIFPWIEFIAGLFLILGLWTRASLIAALGMFVTFLIVVGQALIRQLPLGECGCFGELVSFPPHVVFLMDSVLFILTCLMFRSSTNTQNFSLDQYFLINEAE